MTESLKKPEMILSLVNTFAIIGTFFYLNKKRKFFYRRN
jgi:hypothetical protein